MIATLLSIFFSEWTIFLGVVVYVAYKWSTSTFDFFAKRNVEYEKPVPFFGNSASVMLQREAFFEQLKRLYMKFRKYRYYGTFEMRSPMLVISDPEIIKRVTVKDFEHFLNHRVVIDPQVEPIFSNLFNLKNQKWKDMRATISPAFTGSKMRTMFQLVNEVGQSANKYLHTLTTGKVAVEINTKDFYTRCTLDVIASCAFGLEINSLSDKDNEFYHMARKAMNFSGITGIKFFLFANMPKLVRIFKIKVFDPKFTEYFHRLVLNTMQQREAKGIVRPDMINILIEARKGTLQSHDLGKADIADGFSTVQESIIGQKGITQNWTDDELVAQLFLFFIAGFESGAALMSLCAHELMEHPDVQEKLIAEIDQVRADLNGKPLSYEVLQKMKYLDMVISETLRKWPPAVGADRVCNKKYVIENDNGENLTINPGEVIMIPICGIHYNPDYFPDPDKFDPERFNDENKENIKPFTYMPFGMGPRNCVGSRFALMEIKALIFYVLSEFTFEASPKSTIPLRINSPGFQLQPKSGFWLKLKPRN